MTEGFEPKWAEQAYAHVAEEAGEVIAAFGKAMRFGWMSENPLIEEGERESNLAWFLREMQDLKLAIERAELFIG